jgi:hypothetical protein
MICVFFGSQVRKKEPDSFTRISSKKAQEKTIEHNREIDDSYWINVQYDIVLLIHKTILM